MLTFSHGRTAGFKKKFQQQKFEGSGFLMITFPLQLLPRQEFRGNSGHFRGKGGSQEVAMKRSTGLLEQPFSTIVPWHSGVPRMVCWYVAGVWGGPLGM